MVPFIFYISSPLYIWLVAGGLSTKLILYMFHCLHFYHVSLFKLCCVQCLAFDIAVLLVTGRGSTQCYETLRVPQMAVRLSALRASRPLPPAWLLVPISIKRLSWTQGHSEAGRTTSTEKSNDLIWNQTHELTACNTLPQPCYHIPCH
jgi:hypothetical protein